jgi:hypothetical protein
VSQLSMYATHGESCHMSVERKQGAGISPFSGDRMDNLLSFFKEIPMTVDMDIFFYLVIFRKCL